MNSQTFTAKEKREFNALWLSLKERGLRSVDCARAVATGQFSTRWVRGGGYVVNWKESL